MAFRFNPSAVLIGAGAVLLGFPLVKRLWASEGTADPQRDIPGSGGGSGGALGEWRDTMSEVKDWIGVGKEAVELGNEISDWFSDDDDWLFSPSAGYIPGLGF